MSQKKQPTIKELMAQMASAPAVQLTADASNEQLKQRIREKAIEALNKRERLNREEWQIVSALWDRLEPKNKPSEEEKLSASDVKNINRIYDEIFSGDYCQHCHRGQPPAQRLQVASKLSGGER